MTKNELRTVMVPFFLLTSPLGLSIILTQIILIPNQPLLATITTILNIYTLYRLRKHVVQLMLGEDTNAYMVFN